VVYVIDVKRYNSRVDLHYEGGSFNVNNNDNNDNNNNNNGTWPTGD